MFPNLDTKRASEFFANEWFWKIKYRKRHDLFSILHLTREYFFASYASTVAWRSRWSVYADLYERRIPGGGFKIRILEVLVAKFSRVSMPPHPSRIICLLRYSVTTNLSRFKNHY